MTLTAPQAKALERIFAREIFGGDVAGRMSQGLQSCIDAELCEPCAELLDGRFPVAIKGYMLTHRGRMAYGEWASRALGETTR